MNMIDYITKGFDIIDFDIDLLGFFEYNEITPKRKCYKMAIDMLLMGNPLT